MIHPFSLFNELIITGNIRMERYRSLSLILAEDYGKKKIFRDLALKGYLRGEGSV
jgi:hypothetical protein